MKAPSLALAAAFIGAVLGSTSQPGFGQVLDSSETVPLAATAPTPVPALVPYAGVSISPEGKPVTDPISITFLIHRNPQGGEALWSETETVTPDKDGKFSVQLGSTLPSGLPADLFASGEARWLEVQIAGQAPRARTLLTSVPYAMKSADADSLGGRPVTNFVTQEQLAASFRTTAAALAAQTIQPLIAGAVTGSGTAGSVPLWTGTLTQGNSEITQVGKNVGINEATPGATLDVGGTAIFRGTTTLPPLSPATTALAYRSQLLGLAASAWSTTASAPVAQTFRLYTLPAGNNTASPSGNLYLQFQEGTAAGKNILSIASNGVISFAPAQTFPSSVTTFPKGATFDAESYITGASTDYMLKAVNSNSNGTGAIYAEGAGYAPGIVAKSANGYGVLGLAGDGIGGGFGNSSSGNPTLSVSNTIGPVADLSAASDTIPAFSVTNSSSLASAVGVQSTVSTGTALVLNSPNGNGLVSTVAVGSAGSFISAGIFNPTLSAVNGSGGTALYSKSSGGLLPAAYLLSEGDYQDGAEIVNLANGDALHADAGEGVAGFFQNSSGVEPTVYAYNTDGNQIGTLFKTFMAGSKTGTCGIGGNGDMACTGQLKSLVDAGGGTRKVETYSMQSPENWMEDFGSGTLQNGVAVVGIDPTFSETVSESADYHVFLTPKGDSRGLYVINETATSFEVRESGGGISSLAFDYRIVAKRRGFEGQRHVDVTENFRVAMARSAIDRKPRQGGQPASPAPRIVSPQPYAPFVQQTQILPTPRMAPPPAAERLQVPTHVTAARSLSGSRSPSVPFEVVP